MPKFMRWFWEFDLSVHFVSQCKPAIDSSGPYTWSERGPTAAKIFAEDFLKSAVLLEGVAIYTS